MRDEMGMPLPVEIGSRQAMVDAAPDLKVRGDWLCLNVEPSCAWPTRPQSVQFAGQCIWIIPLTLEAYAGVGLRRPKQLSEDDAEALLYRFLSVLAWRENCGISVAHRTGGSLPSMMGQSKKMGFAIRGEFDFTEIICPHEETPRIALALVREARSLNHHGYAFLSYWRVLEVIFGKKSAKRIAWMSAELPKLIGSGVEEARASIAALGVVDIGEHLWESGRCAIAHATGHPIVNPDDPRDARRLQRELPLVRELAIRAIEQHLGLLTSSTEFALHLYELRGWKEILGADLVRRLQNGEVPEADETVDLPDIHVQLLQNAPYRPLQSMTVASISVNGDQLHLAYRSVDGKVDLRFRLHFGDERLVFNIFEGVFGHDDGSVEAAENKRETQRFFRDYLLNGELQIWNAETGALISRKDAFLPLNCYVDLDACNANIAAAQSEVERRRAAAR